MVVTLVAPSPSRAMSHASLRATVWAASRHGSASRLPVANKRNVSFVDGWVSTWTALKLSRAMGSMAARNSAAVAGGFGADECEHRRHVRVDHAGAFAHAGDRPFACLFRERVGGLNRGQE